MIDRKQIREHMDVMASDGSRIGAVDSVDGDRIKLTRKDSPDGEHHYVSMADVERIDKHVHLGVGRSAVFGAAAAGATGAAAAGVAGKAKAANGHAKKDDGASPLIKNPAVPDAKPRRNFMLPWVLLGLALLGLLAVALWGKRGGEEQRREAIARDQAAQSAGGSTALTNAAGGAVVASNYSEGTFGYDVDNYLAGDGRDERSFTFRNLKFDSGSAVVKDADKSDLADLANILIANPSIKGAVVGYTDASGPASTNAELGAARARAVIAALGTRGVDTTKLEARTGGENNAVAANSGSDKAENRRTEFVVLSR